ncbi:serine/threonine protein kinase [Histoplasma capsulatum var. duboisii H88]|uniref:Serine/threonine protein kinase n=1 Tax=Ajellomyces capsulatus (strain H88) TaxID=544711 RepID=F0ULX5_AJEC8|nr:serine/threonine protein kinase [Histoplasma capsulatum var. duboisii H88]
MEICEQSEAFVEQDGDLIFDHTKLILREDDEYFYARANWRVSSPADISQLKINKILTQNVWPPMDSRYTPSPDPLPPNSYIKEPSLLHYGDTPASLEPGRQLLAEVEVCEVLRRNPHPNIAQYLGCVTKGGRIMGLCFVKYSMTLSQRLRKATPFDRVLCLQGIESGIKHMHTLGLIHNDLNPSNVMMDERDNPVIIDFDSCQREGAQLGLKAGTAGWAMEGTVYATRQNDFFGLSKIQKLLMIEEEKGRHGHETILSHYNIFIPSSLPGRHIAAGVLAGSVATVRKLVCVTRSISSVSGAKVAGVR